MIKLCRKKVLQMALDFAFWLQSQSSLVQFLILTSMAIILVLCLVINEIEEKREYKRFVAEYYNGTLRYKDGHF